MFIEVALLITVRPSLSSILYLAVNIVMDDASVSQNVLMSQSDCLLIHVRLVKNTSCEAATTLTQPDCLISTLVAVKRLSKATN